MEGETTTLPKKIHRCDACGKAFEKDTNLLQHMKNTGHQASSSTVKMTVTLPVEQPRSFSDLSTDLPSSVQHYLAKGSILEDSSDGKY